MLALCIFISFLLPACVATKSPNIGKQNFPYTYYQCIVDWSNENGIYKAIRHLGETGAPLHESGFYEHDYLSWTWADETVSVRVQSVTRSWNNKGDLILSLASEYPKSAPNGSILFLDFPGTGYDYQGWPKGNKNPLALPFLVYTDWSDFLTKVGNKVIARVVLTDPEYREISSREISLEPFREGQSGISRTIREMNQKVTSFETLCERKEYLAEIIVFD